MGCVSSRPVPLVLNWPAAHTSWDGGYLIDALLLHYLHIDGLLSQDEGFPRLSFSSEMTDELLLAKKASMLVLSKPQPTRSPALTAGSACERVMTELLDLHLQFWGLIALVVVSFYFFD